MDKQKYLDLYYQMVLIRRLEERGAELYQAGKIGGFHAPLYRSGSCQHRFDRCPSAA